MNDNTFIGGTRDYNETHEEVMLTHCYHLLDEKPPIRDVDGKIDYRKAVEYIEVGHEKLFNKLTNSIKIQGRIFVTKSGEYVFSCYELLDENDAKEMMTRVAFKLKLPKEKCYYVGHYNTIVLPLIDGDKT